MFIFLKIIRCLRGGGRPPRRNFFFFVIFVLRGGGDCFWTATMHAQTNKKNCFLATCPRMGVTAETHFLRGGFELSAGTRARLIAASFVVCCAPLSKNKVQVKFTTIININ